MHVCEYWGFQENCRTELRLTSTSNHSSWEMRFKFGCRVEYTIRCPDFLKQIQHLVILMKNELVSSSTTIYHCPTWNLPHSERTEFEKVLSHLHALDWLRDWMKKKVCLLRHNSFFILLFIVLSYLYSNVTIIQCFKSIDVDLNCNILQNIRFFLLQYYWYYITPNNNFMHACVNKCLAFYK